MASAVKILNITSIVIAITVVIPNSGISTIVNTTAAQMSSTSRTF